MSKPQVMRITVRNCIRPDTFRYHIKNINIQNLWSVLEKEFGNSRQFGDLDLYEINHKNFLIRAILRESTLTLIKKEKVTELAVRHFHELIGFEGY